MATRSIPFPFPLEEIPRRQERIVIVDTMLKLAAIFDEFIQHRAASHTDTSYVALAVFYGHLSGQPMTAGKIALTLNMPRTTALDRLAFLMEHNYVRKFGRYYYAAGRHIRRDPPYIDRARALLLEAAHQLVMIDHSE